MIGRLTGLLAEKNPPQIMLDVNGVGYDIDVPMSTFYNLPASGEKTTLLTHFAVREDGHYLYGFLTEAERFAFRQLLKVSGIGARTALSVLSGLSVGDLAAAVAQQELGRLIKVPGIGKKDRRAPSARTEGQAGRNYWRGAECCGRRRQTGYFQCAAFPRLQREGSGLGDETVAR
jgi:Holliday junction DNA helicase RuvA subunit